MLQFVAAAIDHGVYFHDYGARPAIMASARDDALPMSMKPEPSRRCRR